MSLVTRSFSLQSIILITCENVRIDHADRRRTRALVANVLESDTWDVDWRAAGEISAQRDKSNIKNYIADCGQRANGFCDET